MTRHEPRLETAHPDTEAMRQRIAARIKLAEEDSSFGRVEDAAAAVGVSLRLYQKWRAADNAPSWPNLVRLGRVFDRSPLWFLEDAA